MGRNPRTGEDAPISARRIVMFKPSAILKQRINLPRSPTAHRIFEATRLMLLCTVECLGASDMQRVRNLNVALWSYLFASDFLNPVAHGLRFKRSEPVFDG